MAVKHRIIVEASFASEIQRDVAMRAIRGYLEGWKVAMENCHKGNEIVVAEHDDAEQPPTIREARMRARSANLIRWPAVNAEGFGRNKSARSVCLRPPRQR